MKLILKSNNFEDDVMDNIFWNCRKYILSAKDKTLIQEHVFGSIVKDKIRSFDLPSNLFEIEHDSEYIPLTNLEKQSWFIRNRLTNKVLIGVNHMNLWKDRNSVNLFEKYMNFKSESENVEIVCIVASSIFHTSERSKTFKLFKTGFDSNRLCYINGLKKVIDDRFG